MRWSAIRRDDAVNQTGLTAILGDNSHAVRMATATKAPPLDVLRSAQMLIAPQAKTAFAAELIGRLKAEGIDAACAIHFALDGEGRVKAKDGTRGKVRIDAIFAADAELENTYRRIANTEELKAQVREMSRYIAADAAANDQAARDRLSGHFAAIFASIMAVSGQLVLVDGTVESPAFDFVGAPLEAPRAVPGEGARGYFAA